MNNDNSNNHGSDIYNNDDINDNIIVNNSKVLVELNNQQLEIISLIKNKINVYIYGPSGSGKSTLIKQLKNYLNNTQESNTLVLTSTTGVSAFNIGGTTLHSYLGIGLGTKSIEQLVRNCRPDIRKKINKCKYLVIDEISMITKLLFEKINTYLQIIRKNNNFFGGITLILSGDFLQLEAILSKDEPNDDLVYKSNLWKNNIKTVKLSKNYRQQTDTTFINLLHNLRYNKLTENDVKLLESKIVNDNDIKFDTQKSIVIFGTNKKVNEYNKIICDNNKNETHIYKAKYLGKNKTLLYDLQKQFKDKNIEELYLKKNYRIMLIRNIDIELGLVNGSLGTIIDFTTSTKFPIIKFDNLEQTFIIEPIEFELESFVENSNTLQKVRAIQLPLVIGYCFSVHKTQGLTLDSAIIDINSCFCNHQVYTAISRLKTLNGLNLLNFNINKIKVNNNSINWLEKIIIK
jgi:ATP-dependent DNA helicase PIF1